MKSLRFTLLAVGLVSLTGYLTTAQARINVVFEHLMGKDTGIPILKKNATDNLPGETFDGSWILDSYAGFVRYDADRLLLGIRENGINESEADHDAALAAQFPDRSLIWIDPDTGQSMGVALVVGFNPVPLDAEFTGAGGSTSDYYLKFTVDDAGVIYANYKNKILRYAPDENGGFGDPTVAYTHTNDGSAQWSSWRFETFHAWNSGADTVLVAGGKSWRDQQFYRVYNTEDGLTFTPTYSAPFKGGGSRVIPAADGTANAEWIYGTHYPGGADGLGVQILKQVRQGPDGEFEGAPFQIATDPDFGYTGQFITAVGVHPDFPYLVSYQTPSWNSEFKGVDGFLNGWIAVHDQFFDPEILDPETEEVVRAELLALHKLDVTEEDEVIQNNNGDGQHTTVWHGTLGDVIVDVLPGMRPGQAELLWYSGIYGYGRYILDFAPKPLVVTAITRDSADQATVTWASEIGKFYDVETSKTLEPESWTTVASSLPGADAETTAYALTLAADDDDLYVRIKRGVAYSEDFEGDTSDWVSATSDDPFANAAETRWEIGSPSAVGPDAAYSGSNVAGTDLDANYGDNANIVLQSPVIDLTTLERGNVTFWHYLQTSGNEGGQVQVLNEAGDTVLSNSEVYFDTAGEWQQVSLNLRSFGEDGESVIGQKVILQFRLLSDGEGADNGAGWYVDDLVVN